MLGTMREHLNKRFPNGVDGVEHEEISWAIADWLSSRGTEWTNDDRKTVEEIGENPDDYMCFDEEQQCRIDNIYTMVEDLYMLMTSPLIGVRYQNYSSEHVLQLADDVARILDKMGYEVYFPTHSQTENGEHISDLWED